ncbi:MAG: response regulator [Ferruginibacter sp.]
MNKVFIIDDDEDDQLMFKEVIETINPSLLCETASNGKIALDKLNDSESLPDLIFLDLNMPVMNGYDFLIHIKKEIALNKIPVCIFTTSNIFRDKELTKAFGAKFFLTKPNDFQVLYIQLQQILSADFSSNEFISIT